MLLYNFINIGLFNRMGFLYFLTTAWIALAAGHDYKNEDE